MSGAQHTPGRRRWEVSPHKATVIMCREDGVSLPRSIVVDTPERAALIVQCVNAHDALVQVALAAKSLASILPREGRGFDGVGREEIHALRVALSWLPDDAAIAKATGSAA